ncbi:glycosyl hydrolase, partial [Pseudomonas sp. GW456-11-11-14-LB1]
MGRWKKRIGLAGAAIITIGVAYAAGWTWMHHWRPSDKYAFQ